MAALFLEIVIDVAKHHKFGVYGTAIIAVIVQAALGVWFMFTIVATYLRWGNAACNAGTSRSIQVGVSMLKRRTNSWSIGSSANTSSTSCTNATQIGLIVFEVFAYIWMSQVVANVTLATLAGGPFRSWYYFGPQGSCFY